MLQEKKASLSEQSYTFSFILEQGKTAFFVCSRKNNARLSLFFKSKFCIRQFIYLFLRPKANKTTHLLYKLTDSHYERR